MDIKYNVTKHKDGKSEEIKDFVSIEEPLEMILKYNLNKVWQTENLSITMSSTTFCVVGGSSQSGDRNDNIMGFNPQSATAIRMYSWNQTGSSTAGEDATFVSAAVFGELA